MIPCPICGAPTQLSAADVSRQRGCCAACQQAVAGDTPSKPGRIETVIQPASQNLGTLNQYRLLAKLGQGGMGEVYKAEHELLRKVVALKVLKQQLTSDSSFVTRFRREMQAVGRLDHPNIVRALDAGEAHGTHYLAMEFVEGQDLQQYLVARGRLPLHEACDFVRQAAIGLQHAHANRLVHRDIKPANLLRTPEGQIKILDLGLARLTGEERQGADISQGMQLGTPDYMAPEQIELLVEIDSRADLYALGCTLFVLLAGRVPYAEAQSFHGKCVAHLSAPIPDIRTVCPAVPAPVAALITRLLAKERDQRPASAGEVAEALEPYCGHQAPRVVLNEKPSEQRPPPPLSPRVAPPAPTPLPTPTTPVQAQVSAPSAVSPPPVALPAVPKPRTETPVRKPAPIPSPLPSPSPAKKRLPSPFDARRQPPTEGVSVVAMWVIGLVMFVAGTTALVVWHSWSTRNRVTVPAVVPFELPPETHEKPNTSNTEVHPRQPVLPPVPPESKKAVVSASTPLPPQAAIPAVVRTVSSTTTMAPSASPSGTKPSPNLAKISPAVSSTTQSVQKTFENLDAVRKGVLELPNFDQRQAAGPWRELVTLNFRPDGDRRLELLGGAMALNAGYSLSLGAVTTAPNGDREWPVVLGVQNVAASTTVGAFQWRTAGLWFQWRSGASTRCMNLRHCQLRITADNEVRICRLGGPAEIAAAKLDLQTTAGVRLPLSGSDELNDDAIGVDVQVGPMRATGLTFQGKKPLVISRGTSVEASDAIELELGLDRDKNRGLVLRMTPFASLTHQVDGMPKSVRMEIRRSNLEEIRQECDAAFKDQARRQIDLDQEKKELAAAIIAGEKQIAETLKLRTDANKDLLDPRVAEIREASRKASQQHAARQAALDLDRAFYQKNSVWCESLRKSSQRLESMFVEVQVYLTTETPGTGKVLLLKTTLSKE